jgi:hypothetical protein
MGRGWGVGSIWRLGVEAIACVSPDHNFEPIIRYINQTIQPTCAHLACRHHFLAWRSAAGETKELQRAVLRAWRKAVEARHVDELACRMADTYNVYRLQRMASIHVAPALCLAKLDPSLLCACQSPCWLSPLVRYLH